MKKRIKTTLLLIVAVTLILGIFATQALATTSTVNITLTPGSLSILAVPGFNFGTVVVPASDTPITATTVTPSTPAIQISEARGGTTGYNLTAQLSAFKDSANHTTLQGAYLTLTLPAATPFEATNPSSAPTVVTPVSLVSGAETGTKLLSAAAASGSEVTSHGQGIWNVNIPAANAILNILGGTADASACSATITWTLADGP